MPLSNSVIRRYTPPTCTLEVMAQSSSLSRWMGKTVIKQLGFELRFDDPRLPEEHRVVIRGDRDQLEALCDAVTSYVQQYLQQSSENFWMSYSGPQDSTKASYSLDLNDVQQSSLSTQAFKSFTSDIPKTKIYLEPSNSLTHKLYLGSLATQTSSVIQLSLLQLFDLATALDEYSTDVMALPALNTNNSVVSLPTWAPIAAVLVLSVGLLPFTLQYANNTRQKQQQVAKTEVPQQSELALQPSPSDNLAIPDNLTTLPPIGSTLPLPTSSLPAQPIIPNPNLSTAQTSSALPPTSSNNLLPQAAITNPNNNQQTQASATIPGQQIALNPNLKLNSEQPIVNGEVLPQKRSLQPQLATGNGNLTSNIPPVIPPPLSAPLPNNSQSNNLPQGYSPTTQELAEKINSSTANSGTNGNVLIDRLGNDTKVYTPAKVATGTLFDTNQIAEARSFFQKRWQPPSGLTQTLEYSLSVDVDGTIARILPLNKPAREFIDDTGMPEIGKPFVSGNRSGKDVKIRVVLSPDGKVQTFAESE
jgi:hypothetical protein